MQRTICYPITSTDAGKDIRTFLREQGYSRHILASLKPRADAVQVNGTHALLRDVLREGEQLRICVEDAASSKTILPAPVPFSIVFEDEDLLVIDKPAGVSIHPAPGHPADTLANGLALYFAQQKIPFVFRCINRLDRDTTGLLLVAKNIVSASILETMVQHHEIRRTYLALVEGDPGESGTIDLPIARKPGSLIERCVDTQGDRAVTHFRRVWTTPEARAFPGGDRSSVFAHSLPDLTANALDGMDLLLEKGKRRGGENSPFEEAPWDGGVSYSLVELQLETGRTHQIRVHMAATGHPLLGDSLYNPQWQALFEKGAPKPDAVFPFGLKRQALHAQALHFLHPITKEPMPFFAPVPEDFLSFLPQEMRTCAAPSASKADASADTTF